MTDATPREPSSIRGAQARRGGVVYLVGAGPGDPSLITVRGAQLLARADVVAYDRLVDPRLLDLATHARHVDVGHRAQRGAGGQIETRRGDVERQDSINRLLVQEARAGHVVVRLKGGDPFVFGRGGEECEALAKAGVRFEVVPGVSSAVAAPAYAGIPLTHRDRASWVAIAAGTQAEGAIPVDWSAVAAADTSVFLMTLRSLENVVRRLLEAGKPPSTPAAVVQAASWPGQRTVSAPLSRIVEASAALEPPAVLVVGSVVNLASSIAWIGQARPLLGRRILLTRPDPSTRDLADGLGALGADVIEAATTRIVDPDDLAPLDEAVRALPAFAWVVFASGHGVDAVGRRMRALGLDARVFARARIAAVGEATASRVRALGLLPDLVPTVRAMRPLTDQIGPGTGRVLLPRAAGAPRTAVEALTQLGWAPHEVTAYRTIENASGAARAAAAIERGVDAVVITAGSGARAFVRLVGTVPDGPVVVCLGAATAQDAREAGLRVDRVAGEPTAAGVAAALGVQP